jgi:hypothetical protein
MSNNNINNELRSKILKGLDLTFTRLVKAKQKSGGYLVFSREGKIVRVKASEITV